MTQLPKNSNYKFDIALFSNQQHQFLECGKIIPPRCQQAWNLQRGRRQLQREGKQSSFRCEFTKKMQRIILIDLKMLISKSIATLLLLSFVLSVSSDLIATHTQNLNLYDQDLITQVTVNRVLQTTLLKPKGIAAEISKIISETNSVRSRHGDSPLSVNATLQTIMKQWAVSIRNHMPMNRYIQLYGVQSYQTYTFAPIPLEYFSAVVLKACPGLTFSIYRNIGTYSNSIDSQNYQIIIVITGGEDLLSTAFSKDDVANFVKQIQIEENKTTANIIKPIQPTVVANVSIIPAKQQNKLAENQTNIDLSKVNPQKEEKNNTIIIQQQLNQSNLKPVDDKSTVSTNKTIQQAPQPILPKPVVVTQLPTQPAIVQIPSSQPVASSLPVAVQTQQVTVQTPSKLPVTPKVQPVIVQTPSQPMTLPVPVAIQTQPVPVQNSPTLPITPKNPVIVEKLPIQPKVPQAQPIAPLTQPIVTPAEPLSPPIKPAIVQVPPMPAIAKPLAQPEAAKAPENVSLESTPKQKNPQLSIPEINAPVAQSKPLLATPIQIVPKLTGQNQAPITVPPHPLPLTLANISKTSNSLPLVALSKPSNSTSFEGIVLSHSIPSTFVKNEIFPFRGYITSANPSGVKVNVIFIRVSDQRRLSFSTLVPRNQSNFEILAAFNLSGSYYLSIFAGQQGKTSHEQYTVIPSFYGQIVSKSPTPLNQVDLSMKGNDLWVSWNYTASTQPQLTKLIFRQENIASIEFLLSNFESSFQVPYSQFVDFSIGSTSLEISQAFSSTESAASRTSDFSAPYTIFFNATTHNYAMCSNQSAFNSIPYQVNTGDIIRILGQAKVDLENQILLQTPRNQFLSYYINSNSSSRYVNAGFAVSVNITLNETGVYILQVNNAGGEAVLNIPIYVGGIYPLLPDFVDLAPKTMDLSALNEPSVLDERRLILIEMINDVRKTFGMPILYMDNNLNNLAQNYSSLEIEQNFISHVDNLGNTPSQRALAVGINESIGENLAVNSNLTHGQLLLQRSPAHLRNIVDSRWTRVGLGIAQNTKQLYFITEQFSSRNMKLYPLTTKEQSLIQSAIVNFILSKYPSLKGENKVLSQDLGKYQQLSTQPDIVNYLVGLKYRNFGVADVEVSYNGGNFMNQVKSGNSFAPKNTKYQQIGVSVGYLNGLLEIFVAYN